MDPVQKPSCCAWICPCFFDNHNNREQERLMGNDKNHEKRDSTNSATTPRSGTPGDERPADLRDLNSFSLG